MKCSIMQPTYLPWSGYFNLIENVDIFVFLDDVQFDRRSWQMRNRINSKNKDIFLSVSTEKNSRDALIKDILLSRSSDWRLTHINKITEAYEKSPFFYNLNRIITYIEESDVRSLADFNIAIIKIVSEMLGIKTTFLKASELGCDGKRTEHLGNICRELEVTQYLSPVGSKEYLYKDGFLEKFTKIDLFFQEYSPSEYEQINTTEFVASLSIIDVISNCGIEKTREYIL